MTPAIPTPDTQTSPKKRGPNTPEGKARSRMNALRHGLRARDFALLPEEDPAEWAGHLADLRHDLGPVDPTEEKLVTAIAVAMWKEIRADRAEAGVLTAIPCEGDAGRDLRDQRHALSLGTAIRYASAAGMAAQRAQRAFLAHRKAKKAGLILTAPATERADCTNDLSATVRPEPAPQNRTNDFPPAPQRPAIDPLAALRTRIRRLLDATSPQYADQHDLAAAILAVSTPDAVPYHGRIDLALLAQALKPIRLDSVALARLATLAPPAPEWRPGPPHALAA